jgi:S-(hydroxymethyl)glutathione dehydrogenase/alcohol dehydrogenase
MTVRGAVLGRPGEPWSVAGLDVRPPADREVCVRMAASGLCHSDLLVSSGEWPMPLPLVGGHEGAGVVESVGAGVSRVARGDHVVLVFNAPCGQCANCVRDRLNLCLMANRAGRGCGSCVNCLKSRPAYCLNAPVESPLSLNGEPLARMAGLGTFAEAVVVDERAVVRIDERVPLDVACLLGCGVATGWGAAVRVGCASVGDVVVAIGAGGVGMSSIQGAHLAGAEIVVAVDPVAEKRQLARDLGATHAVADVAQARDLLEQVSPDTLADLAIISVGLGNSTLVDQVCGLVGRGGTIVCTSILPLSEREFAIPLADLTMNQKALRGNVHGGVNVYRDLPMLCRLYLQGRLKLDELVTRRYQLPEINDGMRDLAEGTQVRGVLVM